MIEKTKFPFLDNKLKVYNIKYGQRAKLDFVRKWENVCTSQQVHVIRRIQNVCLRRSNNNNNRKKKTINRREMINSHTIASRFNLIIWMK